MPVASPAYDLTLGTHGWTEQLLAVDLRAGSAPTANVLVARLPAAATPTAGPSDPAILHLETADTAGDVFTGTIDSIEHLLDATVVTATDASGLLARYRPATTYEHVTAATLVQSLCGDVGADVGQVDEGVQLRFFVADPSRTAYEHIARLAAWSDAAAGVGGDGKVTLRVFNGATADVAVRYGRDVLQLSEASLTPAIKTFVVAGESGVGSADDPDALRPVADFFAGNRPDGPGPDTRWWFAGALRTSTSARLAGSAHERRYGAGRVRRLMTATLQPALRPGSVLEIQDLPDRFAGASFWTESIWHHLSPTSVWTRARLEQAGGGGAASALSSALGGL